MRAGAGGKTLSVAERKRVSRQRSDDLRQHLVGLSLNILGHEGESDGSGSSNRKLWEHSLEMAIRAVKSCHQRSQLNNHFTPRFYREGMMPSDTLGTLLVRTNDLVVLQTNLALSNFWMLGEEEGDRGGGGCSRGLAGQSLWSIVHWDSHEELEELHGMFLRLDHYVVGRSFKLGLLRMTRAAQGGAGIGLTKVVARRIEVFHLSEDGMTALLGVPDVGEEDRRALEMAEECWEFLRRGVQVFKLDFDSVGELRPSARKDGGQSRGDNETSDVPSSNRPGLSFINFPKLSQLAKYAPAIHPTIGLDSNGVLRHMAFARIPLPEQMGASYYYAPLINIRVGDLFEGEKSVHSDGRAKQDLAWMGWMLPGDDLVSQQFPWTAAANSSNFVNFCLSLFKVGEEGSLPGICMGHIAATPVGTWSLTRSLEGNAYEGRPKFHAGTKARVVSRWEGMEEVVGELQRIFFQSDGRPSHVNSAEILPGIWYDAGEEVADIFAVRDDFVPTIRRIPISHATGHDLGRPPTAVGPENRLEAAVAAPEHAASKAVPLFWPRWQMT